MFNIETVPKFLVKEEQYKSIDIVKNNPFTYVLYCNGHKWMTHDQHSYREIKEMYSSYDMAYGDVVISGLGFGILSLWLCSKDSVKSVTVYEISADLIDVFIKNNDVPEKLIIKNLDINLLKTDEEYDCLFLDHYEQQQLSWRLKNMTEIANKIPNHKVFWAWSIEEIYVKFMYELTDEQLFGSFLYSNPINFFDKWEFFRSNFLQIKTLLNLDFEKLNDYIYTYYDRPGHSTSLSSIDLPTKLETL